MEANTTQKTFKQGIYSAFNYLIATAEDFEESATRLRKQQPLTQVEKRQLRTLEEKSRLLRGQASQIENLT